jgi:hypothetical protein
MFRKGEELSSGQLVPIIIIILGFGLGVLALYSIFSNDSLENRDICRLSILERATVPGKLTPLTCQTEKVCITIDDGAILGFGGKDTSCKQFAGEKNVRTVKLKVNGGVNDARATETIQREVANAMYDCWVMTGQGKLDIFPPTDSDQGVAWSIIDQATESSGLTSLSAKPSCIVCSRVAFSDALYEADAKFNFLRNINYNNFLSTQFVPGTSKTYTEVFSGTSGTGYGAIAQQEANSPTKFNVSSQLAIVFAQIKVSGETPKSAFWKSLETGSIMGGIAAISTPGSILSLPIVIVKILAVGAVSTNLALNAENNLAQSQAISTATCGEFESTIEGQKGCSLVKLMNWNVEDINSLCYTLEGNL